MIKKTVDVVLIGAGLTGLTAAFYLHKQGKRVAVIEKENRVGGQIESLHHKGFIFEKGPNTGVISYPEVAELFQDLSPLCELETANEDAKRRLIWKGERFHEIPSSLLGGVTTSLFSLKDKFRILGEPFRAKGEDPNESVASLTRRRLGKSFLNYAVDPFLSGVYAGNPETLITKYALPKLYRLEQAYGSFIKGAIAKAKQPKTDRDKLANKKVFSAIGGLEQIPKAIAKKIGAHSFYLAAKDTAIRPEGNHWSTRFSREGNSFELLSKQVVTTVGGYALPQLLPFLERDILSKITNLHYAPVVQISVGIKDTGNLHFNAFGGLVPSCEKRDVLGILFPSACFEGRAPQKGALFSFFIGGVKRVELTQKTDEELTALVLDHLHSMLKFPKEVEPDLIHIFRHPRAIPQYEQTSEERFKSIDRIQREYKGLILAGNIKDGIGMSDRIKQGVSIARELADA